MAEPVTTEEMAQEAFDKFAASHKSHEWLDMSVDAIFIAGYTAAREALANRKAGEWRPIATAPTDGSHFLISLVDSNRTQHVREAWCEIDDHTDKPALIWVDQSFEEGAVILIPRQWMPLPAPPLPLTDAGG